MKIAYLDTIGGISGDMTLAAFISAGVSVDLLNSELSKLGIGGFEIEVKNVLRNGIAALTVEVVISEQPHYHRHLKDIQAIINNSGLSQKVKDNANKIFYQVALAESKIHNTDIQKIHFHEVGAIDSIVDIVGVSICMDLLGIEAIYTSPIKVGSGGFVNAQHGQLPIPTPATMEILKDYPTVLTDIPFELCTPTGAAIVKALSSGVLSGEKIISQVICYGAGGRDIDAIPNLLRVIIAELNIDTIEDEVMCVETNIDNMNPEQYPFVIEKLLQVGANDAYLIPVIMKKGRPGILISVLTETSKMDKVLKILFTETTTLGVRIKAITRKKIERGINQVKTTLGIVKVKEIKTNGKVIMRPEFEECKRISIEKNIPLFEVFKIIESEIS